VTDHRCGNPHPQDLTACEIKVPNHRTCTGWSLALEGYLDWPNPEYRVPEPKLSKTAARAKLQALAAKVPHAAPAPAEGFAAGVEGSERAARVWDDDQVALVDAAIRTVARKHALGGEFTTDAIWDELGGAVPVTKGLTARLMVARRDRVLDSTGKTEISTRGGHHDHGQRLTIWYSLINSRTT
jgi:hypothetical protein